MTEKEIVVYKKSLRVAYCAGGRNEYADVNTEDNMRKKILGRDRKLVLVEGRLRWQYD